MVLSLIDVAKEKGEPESVQAYWNAYHCLNNVIVANGKMYGRYCKNRFCTICNAIRKADTINRYYPVISQWKDVGSKIFTEPDLNKKSKLKTPPKIYARALDNILVAMKGKRIFDRFGFNVPEQAQQTNSTKVVVDFENWTFPKDSSDWVNDETGEALTGFLPPLGLSYLLNECINKEHC